MARKKRASMREGPLADLFRSTGEAEVAVAEPKSAEAKVQVEEEIRVERVEPVAPEPRAEPPSDEHMLVEDTGTTEQEQIKIERGPEGTTVKDGEMMLDPAKDPAVEEMERRERHHKHIAEEVAEAAAANAAAAEAPAPEIAEVSEDVRVEHEGLERLMTPTEGLVETPEPAAPPAPALAPLPEDGPTHGRDEPDTARYAKVPKTHQAVLRVVGVGGAGVNAVNRMVEAGVPGVEFVAINTDLQSLQNSNADTTLHIGSELTRGLGSGSDPRVGYRAAFEEQDKIKSLLKGSDMVFLACGAGGGTGTGAAPVVAKLARDVGALTVAAVTKPFAFEGARRTAQAEEGIAALGAEVDTLVVVPNERLLNILERRTSMTDAFRVADDVLRQAVQGISDLVMLPGLINLDFADVRTTMLEAGDAILGIGMGVGEHRAMLAAEKAVSSPLLDSSVEGAHSLLLSITGGPDLSLVEASDAAAIVQQAAHPDANIIFGASIDEDMHDEVWITVIATRFDSPFARRHHRDQRGDGPREPRDRDDRGDRTDRYIDPVSDWRTDGDRRARGARLASADEIYGRDLRGRGQDRRPTMPGSTNGGLVLDVPEFIPGH